MVESLLTAFVLGLIGGLVPGPVVTAIFTEIIQSGLLRGFRIVFLGMLTETLVAYICLLLLSSLHLSEAIFRTISFVGAGILVWFAMQIWKITKIDTKKRIHFGLGKIVIMIFSNGVLWLFWVTVAIPKAILLSHQIPFGGMLFLVILELGWLASTSAVAVIFSFFRGWLTQPHIVPFVFKVCSLAFAYFAVVSAYQSIIFFLKH